MTFVLFHIWWPLQESELFYEVEVAGPPQVLALHSGNGGKIDTNEILGKHSSTETLDNIRLLCLCDKNFVNCMKIWEDKKVKFHY